MQAAFNLAERLKEYQPQQTTGEGLLEVNHYLPRERSLVFLVSDFHMPLEVLEAAMYSMQRHHVVPVVLWDAAEYRDLPEFGITHVTDSETGERRSLFLRGDMRARILASFAARREALHQLFMRFDSPPFYIEQGFDPDALTEYFYQFVAA